MICLGSEKGDGFISFLKAIGVLLLLIIVALFGLYAYMGGFSPVSVERGSFGPAEIVFKTYKGPFKNLGDEWEAFQSEWEAAGLSDCNAIGLYLDSPETPQEEQRSVLACRLDGLSTNEQAIWRASFPGVVIPKSAALKSSFPFKNEASFFFAPMKVYPTMKKELDADGLDAVIAIESYGPLSSMNEISFILPTGLTEEDLAVIYEAF